MTLGWQDAGVAVVVLVALGWLVLRSVRARRRGAAACEDCPGARPAAHRPPAAAPRVTVLYSIEPGSPRRKR